MASRRNVGPDATSVKSQDLQKGAGYGASTTGGASEVFTKAMVIEVITTPDDLIDLFDEEPEEGDAESDNPFQGKIKNEDWAKKAPRGSILAKELGDGSSDTLICAYPMLQSHFKLPISVGEQVWIFRSGEDIYWLGRIAGSNVSEDANFTHVDRDLETPNKTKGDAKDKDDKQKGILKRIIARFNDGAGGDKGGAKNAPEGFDTKTVRLSAQFTRAFSEPVPRYTPRPGDLALQGSNNTLITLSTDRGWKKDDEDFSRSNAHEQIFPGSGTIDIVAGRGMLEDPETEITPSDEENEGTEPTRTGMRLILDEEGNTENNKLAKQNEETINQAEGDPDFHTDASRVYVSMNSPIDQRLTILESMPQLAVESQPEDMAGPAIAMKSNEIRVVARHDGSIRIIKEKEEGETGASIIMLPDGTIHVTGETIILGKSKDEGGHPDEKAPDIPPGPYDYGNMQPYVKFSVLEKYLNDVHDALDGFCSTVSTHLCPMNAPSPQLNSAASTLKSKLKTAQKKITTIQSTRIFGE